jgi:hypothetical protein
MKGMPGGKRSLRSTSSAAGSRVGLVMGTSAYSAIARVATRAAVPTLLLRCSVVCCRLLDARRICMRSFVLLAAAGCSTPGGSSCVRLCSWRLPAARRPADLHASFVLGGVLPTARRPAGRGPLDAPERTRHARSAPKERTATPCLADAQPLVSWHNLGANRGSTPSAARRQARLHAKRGSARTGLDASAATPSAARREARCDRRGQSLVRYV